jgi:hypothetical protein
MNFKNIIPIICLLLNSCGFGSTDFKNAHTIIADDKPCKADEACQNNYDKLLEDAYQKITVDSLRTTESLRQARQKLEEAKSNECGDCLDIQKSKWDNIYSKSEEGYNSSEGIVKDFNDSDHKIKMERYKALMEISKDAIQK